MLAGMEQIEFIVDDCVYIYIFIYLFKKQHKTYSSGFK